MKPSLSNDRDRPPRILRWMICWLLMGGVYASAAEQPADVAEFLSLNCSGCHDADTREGDLDLDSLAWALQKPDNFHRWERVFDRVREGEMPPDETLDREEMTEFLKSLHGSLKKSDSQRIETVGRVPARRMTRAQYERNVCNLLAVDLPLSEYLPEDSLTNGFDTVSKSQQISDHSMAAYLEAADVALEAAFNRVLNDTPPASKTRLNWTDLRRSEIKTGREPEGRPEHRDIVSWSTRQNFYGRMPATTVPQAARYRVRLRVEAVHPPKEGSIWCSVRSGVCSARASTMYWVGSFEATEELKELEFEAWIREGHMLQIVPNDRGLRTVSPQVVGGRAGTVDSLGVPGVAIKWIEMERVDVAGDDARQALIGELTLRPISAEALESQERPHQFEIVSHNPEDDLRSLVQSFAQRAFRRPVTDSELKPYLDFSRKRLRSSGSMAEALRAAYRTVLCSSRFLYFEESPGNLDQYALANRLSHFLWGVSPDEELLRLAGAGQLSKPEVLGLQTERLLNDARSETFVSEFTDQWLQLYELNSTTPDDKLYPEYDDVLHHSLVPETHAFIGELIERDLPIQNVVDSDFTFLNSRLARHYGIDWPGGTGLKRVSLDPSDRRGGVITHASILKVTANGTTTSPIIRGVWMLERIMGQHVPPPPANVPAVEPDIRGATSIRDQLDKHRSIDSCAACHVKIDPPGFALESYDVIGGWREKYRAVSTSEGKKWVEGLSIDPSHEFVGGEAFDDVEGMKQILTAKPEQLARNLASQFVTYATGAAPTFADRGAVDAIVDATEPSDFGVRSLLHAVVQSPLFQQK
ncbi:MAG: DUF1592 domain-containing protein [Rubripirellula sp.]